MPDLTHASFDAPFSDEPEDHGGPPGRPLAAAIQGALTRRGVDADPLEESDYAYSFGCSVDGTASLVMVGHVGDSDGRQWLVFVEPARSGLLRRSRCNPRPVTAALHDVLVANVGVEPQWFTEEQWNDPSFGRGSPSPDGDA